MIHEFSVRLDVEFFFSFSGFRSRLRVCHRRPRARMERSYRYVHNISWRKHTFVEKDIEREVGLAKLILLLFDNFRIWTIVLWNWICVWNKNSYRWILVTIFSDVLIYNWLNNNKSTIFFFFRLKYPTYIQEVKMCWRKERRFIDQIKSSSIARKLPHKWERVQLHARRFLQ